MEVFLLAVHNFMAVIKCRCRDDVISTMVNLTTQQIETLFGELEYIEARLKVLDVEHVVSAHGDPWPRLESNRSQEVGQLAFHR